MAWTMGTLASVLLDAEINALSARGINDPVSKCEGLEWLHGQVENTPSLTLAGLLDVYRVKCRKMRRAGNWSCGLLENQHDQLPPQWKRFCLNAISPAGIRHLIEQTDTPLSAEDRAYLLERSRNLLKGSSDG